MLKVAFAHDSYLVSRTICNSEQRLVFDHIEIIACYRFFARTGARRERGPKASPGKRSSIRERARIQDVAWPIVHAILCFQCECDRTLELTRSRQ